jgi:hypothetical protein
VAANEEGGVIVNLRRPKALGPKSFIGLWLFAWTRNDGGVSKRLGKWPDRGEVVFAVVNAACTLAVQHAFGDPPQATPEQVATVVTHGRRIVRTPMAPLVIEAVLRHELGEDVPVDDIDLEQLLVARELIYLILMNSELRYTGDKVAGFRNSDADVKALLAEAERLAAERGFAPVPASV